jgi:hypothetical protein
MVGHPSTCSIMLYISHSNKTGDLDFSWTSVQFPFICNLDALLAALGLPSSWDWGSFVLLLISSRTLWSQEGLIGTSYIFNWLMGMSYIFNWLMGTSYIFNWLMGMSYIFNWLMGTSYIFNWLMGTSTSQGAKCAYLVSAYQGTLENNSLYYIDFRHKNLHNL